VFRTVRQGHGRPFWSALLGALSEVAYDGVLSVENEDASKLQAIGARRHTHSVGSATAAMRKASGIPRKVGIWTPSGDVPAADDADAKEGRRPGRSPLATP
jgi:hypothetical protein